MSFLLPKTGSKPVAKKKKTQRLMEENNKDSLIECIRNRVGGKCVSTNPLSERWEFQEFLSVSLKNKELAC